MKNVILISNVADICKDKECLHSKDHKNPYKKYDCKKEIICTEYKIKCKCVEVTGESK